MLLPRTSRFLSTKSSLFITRTSQLKSRYQYIQFANMSSHSKACCTIPPIVTKDYAGKGKYETIDGRKTYVTGPATATTAIVFIYDIFGFFPQTLQGADILATADSSNKYQVFMPDFFEGEPCNIEWYPPTTDEKKTKLGNWFATRGPPMGVEKIPGIVKAIKETYPNIKNFAAMGFCWGGKVVSLTSAAGTPWKVAGQSSPAMVDASDAEKVTVPMLMLASKDEDAADVKKFEDALKVDKHVEIVDEIHGYMTARSDLEDASNLKAYEKGYATVLEFFAKHL